ncbi:MAG: DUF3299 domain-containing protein [Bacteroidia bacterium]
MKIFLSNKHILLTITFSLFFLCMYAQPQLDWRVMQEVTYDPGFDEETKSVITSPHYPDELEKLDRKEVLIKGYIIPMDTEGKEYVVSAFPNSSCFFCGNATKESVMELGLAEEGKRFKLDQVATFKGILVLNKGAYGLNYRLEEAQIQ